MKHLIVKTILAGIAFLLLRCTISSDLTGDTSQTGNTRVMGMVVDTAGVPASAVVVTLVPIDYNPVNSAGLVFLFDTTDVNGRYSIVKARAGTYNLQGFARTGPARLLIRNVVIAATQDSLVVPSDTLCNPGSLIIPLPANGSIIYLQGTTLYSQPQPAAGLPGFCVVDLLPAGRIPAVYAWTTGTVGAGTQLVNDSMEIVANDTSIAGIVPAPWNSISIGSERPSGGAAFVNNIFTIAGGGPDIYGATDGCHFVCQALQGNVSITARVQSVEFTDTNAKASLMIRESLEGNASNVAMEMQPLGWATFQWRDSLGDTTRYIDKPPTAVFPQWIRLERRGDTLSGYFSADGINWTLEGSRVIVLPANVYVGMAVTSHRIDKLCTAVFDSVNITP